MAKVTKSSTKENAKAYDDLTAIKGIREARQQWFRDTMKVHTYHDLAALSVDEIEAGLKAEKQFPSRSMIAAWIAQANALAEVVAQQIPVVRRKAENALPGWKSDASFVIEFQTLEHKDGSREQRMTVHHIETDKNKIWWGLEPEEAMDWMLAEAGIEEKAVQPVEAPSAPNYQTNYSDKLQQVLAKSQQISKSPMTEDSKQKSTAQSVPAPSRPTGFSDQMREILARTQGS